MSIHCDMVRGRRRAPAHPETILRTSRTQIFPQPAERCKRKVISAKLLAWLLFPLDRSRDSAATAFLAPLGAK